MDSFFYDLRHAVRGLARRPGFVAVGMFSLALGIAVNVAVFSVFGAILLPPAGVPEPDRLVHVGTPLLTPAQVETLRAALAPTGDVFASAGPAGAVSIGEGGQRAPLEIVSAEFFDALALRPAAGRLLGAADASGGDVARAVVISHSLWQRRFGGDAAIVGAVVPFGASQARVVGIGPVGFRGAMPVYAADVWETRATPGVQRPAAFGAMVRLNPGVDLDSGRTAVEAAVRRLPGLAPEAVRDVRVTTMRHLTRLMWAVVGVVMLVPGLVLLVACANVAGLFAARSEERREEIAVRSALGGSRRRLLRQLLLEGALVALASAAAGLLASRWIVSAVSPWILPTLADQWLFPEIALDRRAVAVALGCSALAALASSLLPALAAVRADVNAVLKRAPVAWGRTRRFGLRDALVVGQLVVTFAFLSAAAICVDGIRAGLRASFGFAPERVLTANLALTSSARAHPGAVTAALADVARLPGVVRATLATVAPGLEGQRVPIERPDAPDRPARDVVLSQVRPDYFALTGARLLRGRFLDERDMQENRAVAVVSAAMARALWDGDPVGRSLTPVGSRTIEVVGVVDDAVRLASLDRLPEASRQPFLFLPLADASLGQTPSLVLLVETRDDAQRLGPELERLLRARHPGLSVAHRATVAELNRRGLVQYDLMSALLLVLGAGCALLGGVGLYATVARAVVRRSREIGVRVALGASPAAVVRLVLRSCGALALAGVALGVPAAFVAQALLRAAIHGLPTLGAATLTAVAALVAAVTAAASYVPVRRATRVDPVVVLRAE
ncbi:MAG: ABC transporter permease [Vicinamibacteria bacterium]